MGKTIKAKNKASKKKGRPVGATRANKNDFIDKVASGVQVFLQSPSKHII